MTTPVVARVFLAHQINTLVDYYDITIITNMNGCEDVLDNISSKVNIVNLPIKRNIMLFLDLKALFMLISVLHKNKFSLVHSVSPKAGLLSAISAWIVRIPNRLHTFTGQVWATKNGVSRLILKLLDKLIVALNTDILVDSHSQKDFLIRENVLCKNFSNVIGSGSISGVDANRFFPSLGQKELVRNKLNININDVVLLFVGRLKSEKGIVRLVNSFNKICKTNKNVTLLVVGQDEEGLQEELIASLNMCVESIRFIGFTKNPEQYMMASDIFVLPSLREGFGNVVIEAACCGIPSIVSDIYGLNDSIVDGETGLLSSVNSHKSLEDAMVRLIKDDNLRIKMGEKARIRAIKFFSQDYITKEILKLYRSLLIQ